MTRLLVAREAHGPQRVQRIHHRDHVERADLGLDEPDQRVLHRKTRPEPHVVVVEEDDEQPHVVTARLGLLGVDRVDLARSRLARRRVAVHANELEGLDGLRLAVLHDLEVLGLQVGDGASLLVGDDRVDTNEVDARAEGGLCRWRVRVLRRGLSLRSGRSILRRRGRRPLGRRIGLRRSRLAGRRGRLLRGCADKRRRQRQEDDSTTKPWPDHSQE